MCFSLLILKIWLNFLSDPYYSTSVDEEIEIIENTEVTSKHSGNHSEVVIFSSESSDSSLLSAPPWFLIKGKYSHPNLICQENEATSGALDTEPWKEFFSARTDDSIQVKVPSEWVHFIARQLLSPEKFDWICKFLQSQMWQIIVDDTNKDDIMAFFIPSIFPSIDQLHNSDMQLHHSSSETSSSDLASNCCTPQDK